jgi:hypothetical protein
MQSLLRTRPENLDDLTVQVALVRPGPIQGGAVHPYIERRQKLREDPSFVAPADHPLLDAPLRETLGVVVFQDQVLEVAMALAGFSVGEAEGLRRAMKRIVRGSSRARSRKASTPRRPIASTTSSSASRASASPSRTRPPSPFSPISRPGCAATSRPSSSARF